MVLGTIAAVWQAHGAMEQSLPGCARERRAMVSIGTPSPLRHVAIRPVDERRFHQLQPLHHQGG